ncbi:MAG: c-type cytochrome domain-containing protein [Planctomycetota bacterium]|jgi:WD40 repeat protein
MMMFSHSSRCWLFLAVVFSLGLARAQAQPPARDFANHVLPILRANCLACHNAQKSEGGLNLETLGLLTQGGDSGSSISIGKSAESELMKRIVATDESAMPPADNTVGAKRLTAEETALIAAWIDAGAPEGTMAAVNTMQWKLLPEGVRPIYAIDATSDGQFVAVGRGNLASVYRWPGLDGAKDVVPLVDPAVQAELQTGSPVSHLDLVQSIAISPDGSRVASGGFRDLKIWRRDNGPYSDTLVEMLRGSRLVLGSPDNARIAKATHTPSIEILKTSPAQVTHRLVCPAPATSIAWSQDGLRLIAITADTSAHLFVMNYEESTEVREVHAQWSAKLEQPLTDLVWVDSQSFVGRTADRKLQWWTATPGADANQVTLAKTDRLLEIADAVALCRYDEGGQPRLAIALADGSIRVVNGVDGAAIRSLAHGAPIAAIAASADNTKLASAGADGAIKAWNVADGAMLWEQKSDYDWERRVEQAEMLAARQKSKVERGAARVPELEKAKQAEMDAQAKLQAARTMIAEDLGKKQGELEAQDKSVAEGQAAMDAAKKAVDEAMKRVEQTQKDLEARQQKQIAAQKAKQDVEMKLATMDKTIAGAAAAIEKAAATLAQFQATLEQEKGKLATLDQQATQSKTTQALAPAVRTMFTPDHRFVVTAHNDGSVRWMRADKGTTQAAMRDGFASYIGWAATSQGTLVAATEDGRAMGWRFGNQWRLERVIGNAKESPFSDRITALDWSQDGGLLVVGSGAPSRFGDLKLVRANDGAIVKDWGQVHSDSILVARFSPDGTLIATGAADKLVRLHRVDADVPARALEGHTHHVLGVAWHDDGHWLASSSADNTVKVWDVETGTALRTIPGFGKEVTALSFVGRTPQILSTSADQQTRLHDATNGNLIRAMGGPGDAMYCAVSAGKSALAFAGGQEGVLWVWQIENGQALQQLK